MHQACTQHFYYIANDLGVVLTGLPGAQGDIVQARGRQTLGVADHLHQQYPVDKAKRLRHPNIRRRQPIEGIHLGVEPRLLLLFLAVAGLLGHGPRAAAIALTTPLLILHRLLKATLFRFLEYLGTAPLPLGEHHVDLSLFATHQLTLNRLDEAVINQRLQSLGYLQLFTSSPLLFLPSPAATQRLIRRARNERPFSLPVLSLASAAVATSRCTAT